MAASSLSASCAFKRYAMSRSAPIVVITPNIAAILINERYDWHFPLPVDFVATKTSS